MKKNTIIFIAIIFLTVIEVYSDGKISNFILNQIKTYEVHEVLSESSSFENFSEFSINGIPTEGISLLGYSGYKFRDLRSNNWVYIVSDRNTLPKENQPAIINVRIYNQVKLTKHLDVLFLQEV